MRKTKIESSSVHQVSVMTTYSEFIWKKQKSFFTTLYLISKTCIRFLPIRLKTWLKPVYHSIVKIVYCPCDLLDHKYIHNARDSTQGGHMTKKELYKASLSKRDQLQKTLWKWVLFARLQKPTFISKVHTLPSFNV